MTVFLGDGSGAGDEDGGGEGVAEEGGGGGAADADLPGAFEGELLAEGEADAGADALRGEVAEHGGVFVGDADDFGGLAGAELGEGLQVLAGEGAVEGGDGVAVGVELGVAELGGDALFEALGDEVLEALGLLVDLVPGVVEDLVEEGFEEAMVADDLEGALAACAGELDAVVFAIENHGRLGGGELLEHVGGGGSADGELDGDLGAGDLAFFASAELEDGLEVVVYCFAACFAGFGGS